MMDKEERARLLDTLRKRRSRKKDRALNEGLPEDHYITAEDYIDFYERQDADELAIPRARTSTPRQKHAAAAELDEQDAEQGSIAWLWLGAGVVVGAVFGIPLWIARHMK